MKMGIYNNSKLKFAFILGIFILSWAVFLSESYALEIRVKEEATVNSDMICLGDIASFSPDNDPRVPRLSKIDVASAPSPGNVVRLNRRFLNYKIGSAIMGKDDIRLKVPGSLVVKRTAQFISSGQLEDIFKEHVRSHSPWPSEKMVFERISTPGTIAMPAGNLHWDVREKGNPQYPGNIALTIDLRVNGKLIRKVPVSGKISIRQEVIKAVKKIRKGELISRDELVLVRESSSHLRKDVLTSLDDVLGKRSVRNIQAGQFITSNMIDDPPLVKKGKRVVIKAQNELITATTLGKVMEDGRAGDQVRVINISSGKEILATVRGPGLVEVNLN